MVKKFRDRGSTLYEILFVLTILAILGIIGIAIYNSSKNRAENSRRIADINAIGKAYEVNYHPEIGYQNLTPDQFVDNKIPQPGNNATYNFVFGPDSQNTCEGLRVCTPLEPSTENCVNNSATCYCYTGTNTNTNQCNESGGIASCPAGFDELDRISGTVVHPSVAGQYPTRITRFINPPSQYNPGSVMFKLKKGEGHPDLGCTAGINNDSGAPQCDDHQLNEGLRIRLNNNEIFHAPDKNDTDPNYDDSWEELTINAPLTPSYSNRIEIDHDASGSGPGSVLVDLVVCAQT